jgi:superfamily II DNA/RNA helicase
MNDFANLGTSPFFTGRLSERAITNPTEIQRLVMPRILSAENLIFCSSTGTGKTFAYLIPLFQLFLESFQKPEGAANRPLNPVMLIAAPTYELCSQIKQEADFLLKDMRGSAGAAGIAASTQEDERPDPRCSPSLQPPHGSAAAVASATPAPFPPVKAALRIGSAAISRQIDTLKKDKPALIIGNPGRLLQLARMGKLKLNRIQYAVLDEGDRLIQDDLFPETSELMGALPPERLTVSCSATMQLKNREKLLPFMGASPAFAEASGNEILRDLIEHWAFFSEDRGKIGALRSLIAALDPRKALVFTSRNDQVGNIVSQLQFRHIAAAGLTGALDKKNRKQAMDDFRSGRIKVLVSSDLAARGLDIPNIGLALALDLSPDPEAYIHRAGRTGRAGKHGIMAVIGNEQEMHRLAAIEKKLGIVVYPKALYNGRVCPADSEDQ